MNKKLLIFIMPLVLFLLGGPLLAAPPAKGSLQKIQKLAQQGNLPEAKRLLHELIAKQPNVVEPLLLMGKLHLWEEDVEEARAALEQASKLAPDSPDVLTAYGTLLLREGDFGQSADYYQRALQHNPFQADAHLGMGRLHLSRMELQEAEASLKQSLRLNRQLADAYYYCAEIAALRKDTRQEVQYLQKYLLLRPILPVGRVQNARAMLAFLSANKNLKFDDYRGNAELQDIPYTSMFGLIVVRTFINGKGPYKFLVDSGATTTAFSQTLFQQLKIKPAAVAEVRCLGGTGKMTTQLGIVQQIKLGETELLNVPVTTFDASTLEDLFDGVLSLSDLGDFRITIDPTQEKITLFPQSLSASADRTAGDKHAQTEVDFHLAGSLIVVPVSVAGQKAKNFLFDTGALTSVLSYKQAKLLGARLENASTQTDMQLAGACGATPSVVPVGDVSLKMEGLKKDYPQILAIDLETIEIELETGLRGILGIDFYAGKKITIDYRAAKLMLE